MRRHKVTFRHTDSFGFHVVIVIFGLVLFFCPTENTNAATYAVCAVGCEYSTIQGVFSSNDLGPGDIVDVYADTPGSTKTFMETVSPGPDDFGVVGDPLLIRGHTGDTIIIDAQNLRNYCLDVNYATNDYITFTNFTLINATGYSARVRPANSSDFITGFTFTGNNVIIAENGATSNAHEGFLAEWNDDLVVSNNNITTADAAMPYQTDGIYIQNSLDAVIENNTVEIRNDNGVGHNDCMQLAAINYMGNMIIRNNTFIQNSDATTYTQNLYLEYPKEGTIKIYNNKFVVSNLSTGSYALTVTPKSTSSVGVWIENNSFWLNGNDPGIRTDQYVARPYIRNNALHNNNGSSNTSAIWIESSGVVPERINNNIWYLANAGGNMFRDFAGFKTWLQWQAAGYDTSGYNVAPGFNNLTDWDLSLSSSSFALNKGMSLGADFNDDILGNVRSGAWDIGAYEYVSVTPGDLTAPATPNGLAVQ